MYIFDFSGVLDISKQVKKDTCILDSEMVLFTVAVLENSLSSFQRFRWAVIIICLINL